LAGLETNYPLAIDGRVRPNQTVVAVGLEDAVGEPQKNSLLAIKSLPETLDRKRVGGVVAWLGGSPDLRSEDPKAAVQIVLQSNHDHWILVGQVSFEELRGGSREVVISFDDPEVLDAMHELYSLRFHLRSNRAANGRIYLDDLGFILRGQ
jgi:hypothetical protein